MVNKVGLLVPHPKDVDEMFLEARQKLNFDSNVEVLKPLTPKERIEVIKEASALITNAISSEELDIAKNLGFIQVPFAGVDTFNLNELFKRNIMVANVHSNSTSVAEFAFTLLLTLAKDIVRGDRDLRRGYWHGWVGKEPNIELEGKTVCIVGFGSIGKKIANFAKAFGMKVVGVKRTLETVPQEFEMYSQDNLKKAVSKADFVVSTLPLTLETKGIFNREIFEAMRGKYFVNVGRGLVVNEEDFFEALKNKVLKGAAIDTWWVYPEKPMQYAFPSKYPIWQLDNIIMTPHGAGQSDQSVIKMWLEATLNVVKYLKGEKPDNLVTEKGY